MNASSTTFGLSNLRRDLSGTHATRHGIAIDTGGDLDVALLQDRQFDCQYLVVPKVPSCVLPDLRHRVWRVGATLVTHSNDWTPTLA
jgi:hypothetical protein